MIVRIHLFATALAASALLLAGCSGRSASATTATDTPPPAKVRVVPVRAEQVPVLTEVMGVVRPLQRAVLAAKVMGAIEEMPITLGQRVRAGDVMVKISASEISARRAQAMSQLNAARRDLERERDLLPQGASTADMVKGLEDRFATAQAIVSEAETMLGYTTIRAPFDGVIARKPANAGDLASPGIPLVEIEGTTDFQVEAAVPDSLAARLSPNTTLLIEVPAIGSAFQGQLAELSSSADANAHTVLAKIAVPKTVSVRSGEFARVRIPGEPVAALLVPASAVTQHGQLERVFVAVGNTTPSQMPYAELRLVKTGAAQEGRVEILSGLDHRDRVIVAPPPTLREGQALQVIE